MNGFIRAASQQQMMYLRIMLDGNVELAHKRQQHSEK